MKDSVHHKTDKCQTTIFFGQLQRNRMTSKMVIKIVLNLNGQLNVYKLILFCMLLSEMVTPVEKILDKSSSIYVNQFKNSASPSKHSSRAAYVFIINLHLPLLLFQ